MIALVSLISVAFGQEDSSGEACPKPLDDQEIRGVEASAEQAFANLDANTFTSARDELLGGIECAGEPLTTSSAAGFFRVRALDAHLRRAPEDLLANARAMAEIDPAPPSTAVTPRGHPVRSAWERAKEAGPSETIELPVPGAGTRIRVDGRDTLDFPTERPVLLQLVKQDGSLVWTRVVEPGGKWPAYEEAPEDFRDDYVHAVILTPVRKPIELPILASIFGAGAIGTYAATFKTKSDFKNETDPANLRSRRQTNNNLVLVSGGLAAVTVGLGAWTVATW